MRNLALLRVIRARRKVNASNLGNLTLAFCEIVVHHYTIQFHILQDLNKINTYINLKRVSCAFINKLLAHDKNGLATTHLRQKAHKSK